MKKITIGQAAGGSDIDIDLDRLIESRMLVQANSGSGKSWALRRILEQTHGEVQQIVLDVEDEFHTLREKYDYILAGSGAGDCPADTRGAALLARKLLELNVSAIVGIYELKAHERVRFVRLFLDALVNAPKNLWHPVLVVLDEAHIFAPQVGQAESTGAVIDLMTRGRKRGFCGVLATQRIAKLHKDAAADANNKLIGRSALDVDMKRAADELGLSGREDQAQLRILAPGEFFVFGPAISDSVKRIKVGPVSTAHPKAGQKSGAVTPPRGKVLKVLEQLKDLPHQVEEEARTVEALRAKIRELERAKLPSGASVERPPSSAELEKAKEQGRREGFIENERILKMQLTTLKSCLEKAEGKLVKIARMSGAAPAEVHFENVETRTMPGKIFFIKPNPPVQQEEEIFEIPSPTPVGISKCARAILEVLYQYRDMQQSAVRLAILSEYSVNSSGFANALSELRVAGLISGGREAIRITALGTVAAGPAHPMPTSGRDLLDHWLGKLGKAEGTILRVVCGRPDLWTKQEISDESKYSMTSSGFANALSKLRVLGLIEGRNDIQANRVFFES